MSTRAVLGRVEEEVAAITTRHDAAVARSGSLQRELEEQQHAAACEAEAAAATLRHAMETGAGQAAGAAQAAQAAQAAADRSVRGLQGQVNDLDQRLQQALAQACGSRTRSNLFPAAPDRALQTGPLLLPQVRMQEDALAQGEHDLEHAQSASADMSTRMATTTAEVPTHVNSVPVVAHVSCDTQQRILRSKGHAILCCAGGRAA